MKNAVYSLIGDRARVQQGFQAAALENAISRMYSGVHFRVDMRMDLSRESVGWAVVERLMHEADLS